jgi:hypothetical protein
MKFLFVHCSSSGIVATQQPQALDGAPAGERWALTRPSTAFHNIQQDFRTSSFQITIANIISNYTLEPS